MRREKKPETETEYSTVAVEVAEKEEKTNDKALKTLFGSILVSFCFHLRPHLSRFRSIQNNSSFLLHHTREFSLIFHTFNCSWHLSCTTLVTSPVTCNPTYFLLQLNPNTSDHSDYQLLSLIKSFQHPYGCHFRTCLHLWPHELHVHQSFGFHTTAAQSWCCQILFRLYSRVSVTHFFHIHDLLSSLHQTFYIIHH